MLAVLLNFPVQSLVANFVEVSTARLCHFKLLP